MESDGLVLPRLTCRFFKKTPDWESVEPAFFRDTATGHPPQQATWVKIAWTEREFHILFKSWDTHAWATKTSRDDLLYEEEVVEVFLDPVGDFAGYFEIEVNPLNTVCDLVLRRTSTGYRKSFAWHCEGLRTAVELDQDFWRTEITIPWASLGSIEPAPGRPWRANFCRIDRPENSPRELTAWSPTGRPLFHVPPRFGWLDFVR